MVIPSSNGHPHLWEIRDSKIIPQALVENQSPVSLPRRYAPRKERLGTDFQPRPSGDFAVSVFPEVRISTVLFYFIFSMGVEPGAFCILCIKFFV